MDLVTLEHAKIKDPDGKPRTYTCAPETAETLLRGDRGWRRKDQPRTTPPKPKPEDES